MFPARSPPPGLPTDRVLGLLLGHQEVLGLLRQRIDRCLAEPAEFMSAHIADIVDWHHCPLERLLECLRLARRHQRVLRPLDNQRRRALG